MTTPKLNELLGAKRELDLTRVNSFVRRLLTRFAEDEDTVLLRTASALPRTRQSMPALALMSQFMMRDVIEAGGADVEDVYILFLVIVFVFAIDDHMDTTLDPAATTAGEVAAYTQRMITSCRDRHLDEDDDLIRYIVIVTERLRAYPAFATYEDAYFRAFTSMLDGMVQEFSHRDPHATNLDHYMTYAGHSVGITFGLTSSLILLGDTTLVARIDRLWVVYEIIAAVIRYANDIRSYERELAEGKFSSFQLAAKKYGIALAEIDFNQQDIIRLIRAMMIAEAYDLRDALHFLQCRDGHFESVIINVVLGVVSLYEVADFHTLPLASAED